MNITLDKQSATDGIIKIALAESDYQPKVEEKTKELKEINSQLEERIKKEVEENLKKDRLLSQQQKMISMGQMIENIAHQWRQPLSIISTIASGMKIQKQIGSLEDSEIENNLESIIKKTQYLSTTIDQLDNFISKEDNIIYIKKDGTEGVYESH